MHDPARDTSLPPIDGELSRLIAAMCGGVATQADRKRLEILLQDSDAQRAYVAFTRLNADLRWQLRRDVAAGIVRAAPHEGTIRPRVFAADRFAAFTALGGKTREIVRHALWLASRPAPFAFLVTVALIGGVLATAGFFLLGRDGGSLESAGRQSRGRIVAHVTGTHEARWRNPLTALDPRLGIARGTELDLAGGLVELAMAGGARVILEGPVRIGIRDGVSVDLHRGTLTAHYDVPQPPPDSDGSKPLEGGVDPAFVVYTPTATVTDLGTEFGVRVAEAGDSEVLVFAGLVEVEPVQADPAQTQGSLRPVRLGRDEARLVDSRGMMSPIDAARASRIVRSLPEGTRTSQPPDWVEAEAEVIYCDHFDGSGALQGTSPASRGGVGDAVWQTAGDDWSIADGELQSIGTIGSASLPFSPESGVVYRLSAVMNATAQEKGLANIGFLPSSDVTEFWRNRGGYAWMSQRARPDPIHGGNFASGTPSPANRITDIDVRYGRHTRMVQLDTRGRQWRAQFFVDGEEVAWFVFDRKPPPIHFASLGYFTDRTATFDDFTVAVYRPKRRPTDSR